MALLSKISLNNPAMQQTIANFNALQNRDILSEFSIYDNTDNDGYLIIAKFNRSSYQNGHLTDTIKSLDDAQYRLNSLTYSAHNQSVVIILNKR
jgi:hypothetical protein